jgi:hypothetical protein
MPSIPQMQNVALIVDGNGCDCRGRIGTTRMRVLPRDDQMDCRLIKGQKKGDKEKKKQ